MKFGETLRELDLGDKIGAIGELGIDLGSSILEGGGDVVEGVGGALNGLLGGDKDKEDGEDKPKDDEEDKGLLDSINPF